MLHHSITVFLIIICIILLNLDAESQELTLPLYEIIIDPAYWELLNADPTSDRTYPAEFHFQNVVYPCKVRYRGSTSRQLPKRSWKIQFDDEGPAGEHELNLNAEYRDPSLMRNHLCLRLADYGGLLASLSRFVSLKVNHTFNGVYLEIEQIDELFFHRRGISAEGALFKSSRHCARFAPLLDYRLLTDIYEPKIIPCSALDTLQNRLAFFNYADWETMARSIDQIVNVDNIINYFAFTYAISNYDGFTKNFYIHEENDHRYTLIPWDCDATLGVNWEGNQDPFASIRTLFTHLNQQGLFQRIIENPHYAQMMRDRVEWYVTEGFDSLRSLIPEVFNQIRHDVYLDTFKRENNETFELQDDAIIQFTHERREALMGIDLFNRTYIKNVTIVPEYLLAPTDTINIEVEMEESPLDVSIWFIDHNYEEAMFHLYDNGSSGDEIAGDLTYSRKITLENCQSPFYYFIEITEYRQERSWLPAAGKLEFATLQISAPSIRVVDRDQLEEGIHFGSMLGHENTESILIPISHNSVGGYDLSGCLIRLNHDPRMMRIPEIPPLSLQDTLFITNHPPFASSFKPDGVVAGCFLFRPSPSDTLFLLSPSGKVLSSSIAGGIDIVSLHYSTMVINEINFNSCDNFDPGDWVELYCTADQVDLLNWSLRDQVDAHSFVFTETTPLQLGEYLVVVNDLDCFQSCFSDPIHVIGSFDYGFSGDSDQVRLFDDEGRMVDCVSYSDEILHLQTADGEGATLELENPYLDNYGMNNWRVSNTLYGTPGRINSVYRDILRPSVELPQIWKILKTYPNPTNSKVMIQFTAPSEGIVIFTVYDLLGRQVDRFEKQVPAAGVWVTQWDGSSNGVYVSSGIYFSRLSTNNGESVAKLILLR